MINVQYYKILMIYIFIYSLFSQIMSIYIYSNNCDSDLVSYYHDVLYFLSHSGEKSYHCIVSSVSYILEKTCQCINNNEKSDKPYQCIYDESYVTQNIGMLKLSNKHTGEILSTSASLFAIYIRGKSNRKTMFYNVGYSKNLYLLYTPISIIIIHTENIHTQVYILYRIGRSMSITHCEYVR